jgi:hypothetical protein
MLATTMLDCARPRDSDEMQRLPISLLDDCLLGVVFNRTDPLITTSIISFRLAS